MSSLLYFIFCLKQKKGLFILSDWKTRPFEKTLGILISYLKNINCHFLKRDYWVLILSSSRGKFEVIDSDSPSITAEVTYEIVDVDGGSLAATEVEICGEKYNRFEVKLDPDTAASIDKLEAHYIDMAKIIPDININPSDLNPKEFRVRTTAAAVEALYGLDQDLSSLFRSTPMIMKKCSSSNHKIHPRTLGRGGGGGCHQFHSFPAHSFKMDIIATHIECFIIQLESMMMMMMIHPTFPKILLLLL